MRNAYKIMRKSEEKGQLERQANNCTTTNPSTFDVLQRIVIQKYARTRSRKIYGGRGF
jgi:hypothetical protein